MGARPIAALNSLRFGNIQDQQTRHLLKGVVAGIGHYGNCFGVPTVGGEVYFESCYHTNPLVNAMSVGIVKVGQTVSATAAGEGNPVFIVGSATGKDGIGGASFASADITEESTQELPAVQVGDPFQEKKLLEACLELIPKGALVGMQDMGAAGIICSTAETSAKGGVGMHIELDKVPMRQQNMKAWELLMSESQERMLMIVEKGREAEVLEVFEKWDLPCSEIGHVTLDGILRFYMHGELEAEMPAESLVLGGGAPVYDREYREPAYFAAIRNFNADAIPVPADLQGVARELCEIPNIASKRWIYTQYDSMVGTGNTQTNGQSDAPVVLVKETGKALAVTTDCNSRYVYADPYKGAMIAVSEAARNIVCSGGTPIGVTNCLNFGNPYDPEIYYQFVHAIKGMGEACLRFDTPVTGGNVSFYNQNPDGAVYPTPTIGMVGVLDTPENKMTLGFRNAGDVIYLIGNATDDICSSEYLHKIGGVEHSPAPHFDIAEEVEVQKAVAAVIAAKLVVSAHDVSEGGLFITLLESGFAGSIGFAVEQHDQSVRKDAYWFGEGQSRVVVSVNPSKESDFLASFAGTAVAVNKLGIVAGDVVVIGGQPWGNLQTWQQPYDNKIGGLMQ
jgi:phosphoribosylformylglycinamidine synthase